MIINEVVFNVDLYDILTELKQQLDVNGIQLLKNIKNTPDNIMLSCPYHKGGQENRPSAGIRKTDGQFHCLACGETHTLQEVISHCFGHTDDYIGAFGWTWLLKNFLTISVEERKDVELDITRNHSSLRKPSTDGKNELGGIYSGVTNISRGISYIPETTLETYRYYHPYMYKRKLTNEIIELFDIGYDKDTRCITFPVRDVYGHTLFVARRSIDTKYFNYPAGAEKPVYGLYEIKLEQFNYEHTDKYRSVVDNSIVSRLGSLSRTGPEEVIICESMLDALYFWTIDKYAVALNGLGTQSQFDQLNRLPCRKFILCTDNDAAGMKARKRIRENLKNKLVTEYILPQGRKDANDCTIEELQSLQEVF